jgi:hypothetical protein
MKPNLTVTISYLLLRRSWNQSFHNLYDRTNALNSVTPNQSVISVFQISRFWFQLLQATLKCHHIQNLKALQMNN